jgi:hypothetical protein
MGMHVDGQTLHAFTPLARMLSCDSTLEVSHLVQLHALGRPLDLAAACNAAISYTVMMGDLLSDAELELSAASATAII